MLVIKQRSWLFSEVLDGLGSSRKQVGIISTYPSTSPTPWSSLIKIAHYNMRKMIV